MKKRIGKIAIWAMMVLFLAACAATWIVPMRAQAATAGSHTFTLQNSTSVTFDANTYITLENMATGDFVAASTGVAGGSVTWANAAIATAAHSINTATYIAQMPALSRDIIYVMRIWTGTNYSTADTLQVGPVLYDPYSRTLGGPGTYSDSAPLIQNRTRITME